MEIFCFASTTLTNIWAGIGAGMWAVKQTSPPNMKGRITKSKRMRVGSIGLLYCNETHSFTTPFIVYSVPEPTIEIKNIWDETWYIPFRIHPLGNPNRQISVETAKQEWDVLKNLQSGGVTARMNITGTTVFVPIEISSDDWARILSGLAEL